MRIVKIVLAIVFVIIVTFFVVRSCAPTRPGTVLRHLPRPILLENVRPGKPVARPAPKAAPEAKMAIILDDWGNNFPLLSDAIQIHRPLTVSILPHLAHSRRIADEAFSKGLGVMLHMPMEPEGRNEPLEPQTIMVNFSDSQITRALDEALDSVPHAEGVNNHMGSAATSDRRVMQAVIAHLKEKNLFFVDSNVIPKTVGWRVAQSLGVRFARRDVFIDNDPHLAAVERELRKAAKAALARGRVVVIGHDKKATLEAIKEMAPEIERAGVRLVLVKELLE
ncbi:MAG: divergent polysaccharide deacetylase family protein [Candidatus Omnitrophica bacterium]|nr:divergent polysaccharide deacetylase family protein [Candidatus Omnitrophota bacterium]